MLVRSFWAAMLSLALAASHAFAGDDDQSHLVQVGDTNIAHLSITGSGNSVSLYQEMPPDALDGNVALITIHGDRNGAGGLAGGSLFTGLGLGQPLKPGHVDQIGTGNRFTLSVTGNDNLFAFLQNGAGNVLTGSIAGSANQVAAMQLGAGNVLNFSQIGHGNMLSVTQISR